MSIQSFTEFYQVFCSWINLIFSSKFGVLIGASLSEPHINVLNASGVCMYVCMYVCVYVFICRTVNFVFVN